MARPNEDRDKSLLFYSSDADGPGLPSPGPLSPDIHVRVFGLPRKTGHLLLLLTSVFSLFRETPFPKPAPAPDAQKTERPNTALPRISICWLLGVDSNHEHPG